jgi:Tol biopolymer transport system component
VLEFDTDFAREATVNLRRALTLVSAFAVILTTLTAVTAGARAVFPGANGRIAFSSNSSGRSQIYSIGPDGSGLRQLTHVANGQAATEPEISPDGARILFTKKGQVWVMNADGSGQQQLTGQDGFEDEHPSWSPDGSRIVFSHCNVLFGTKAYCDIEVINADGTNVKKILGGTWDNRDPEYSPDGHYIAFSSTRGGYISAVWVMNANGGAPKRLTDPFLEALSPDWSPDGTHILFGTHFDVNGAKDIWVMNADGSDQRNLSNMPLHHNARIAAYSPGGGKIALLTDLQHPGCGFSPSCDLYLMDADGANLHPIPNGLSKVGSLDWGPRPTVVRASETVGRSSRGLQEASATRRTQRHVGPPLAVAVAADHTLVQSGAAGATSPRPDGRIAFFDITTGQIYAINPDGTSLVQLTHLPAGTGVLGFAWSPNGKHIVFASTLSGKWRLWIMGADGGNLRLVLDDRPGVADQFPTYTPNGRKIVFTRIVTEPSALYSVRVDGTNLRALTHIHWAPTAVFDILPSVSPNGRRIAFERGNENGIISQIYVMRADGSGAHAVTPPALEGWSPAWSPDGRRLTFTSNCCFPPFGDNIYVMNANGTGIRRLTDTPFPHSDYGSAYSPQGDQIAFSSDRRYDGLYFCCSDLFVMRANGTRETLLRTGLTGVEGLDWGTAPPIPAGSSPAPSIPSASPAQIRARVAAWCKALPAPIAGAWCGGSR